LQIHSFLSPFYLIYDLYKKSQEKVVDKNVPKDLNTQHKKMKI